MTVVLALSYSGRDEIVRMVKKIGAAGESRAVSTGGDR